MRLELTSSAMRETETLFVFLCWFQFLSCYRTQKTRQRVIIFTFIQLLLSAEKERNQSSQTRPLLLAGEIMWI